MFFGLFVIWLFVYLCHLAALRNQHTTVREGIPVPNPVQDTLAAQLAEGRASDPPAPGVPRENINPSTQFCGGIAVHRQKILRRGSRSE